MLLETDFEEGCGESSEDSKRGRCCSIKLRGM